MPSIKSRLKRLKLKKLQPGLLVQKIAKAGAVLGVPGAAAADKVITRIGKRVDQANRVYGRAKAEIAREAKQRGTSQWEAADRLADRALAGADAGLGIERATPMLLIVAAVVVAFMMLRRGK